MGGCTGFRALGFRGLGAGGFRGWGVGYRALEFRGLGASGSASLAFCGHRGARTESIPKQNQRRVRLRCILLYLYRHTASVGT